MKLHFFFVYLATGIERDIIRNNKQCFSMFSFILIELVLGAMNVWHEFNACMLYKQIEVINRMFIENTVALQSFKRVIGAVVQI